MSEAIDVLRDIDRLRRDLSGYHGQLKAHNDLQRHCDNQRGRISELEGLYARAKAENEQLREELEHLQYGYGSVSREHSQAIVDLSDAHFEIDKLKDENEKLRELVRHMWGWLTVPSVNGAALHDISGQMHELGIEVGP